MTWKRRLPFFSQDEKKEPLIRIDGSLSGSALLEEGTLTRLREAVSALSAARPYTYDLELGGGRFSLILLQAILPANAFEPDPETAIARDLQTLLDTLPPQERTQVQSTFRALWHEGGEVMGVVFPVEPPGRIQAQKRIRTEEEYDRLAAEQAAQGYVPPSRPLMPRWTAFLLGFLVLAAGSYFIYLMGPERQLKILITVLDRVELKGLQDLIEVRDFKVDIEAMSFVIQPLPDYRKRLEERLSPEWPSEVAGDSALKRLAAEALVKGRLNLEIFDEEGKLLDTLPLDLGGFDGTEPFTVLTRSPHLAAFPSRVQIGP